MVNNLSFCITDVFSLCVLWPSLGCSSLAVLHCVCDQSRPVSLTCAVYFFCPRLVGAQQWTTMETHSNKSVYMLSVLRPDTTYQVKVVTQCLSKQHKTNEMLTLRTPEGCEWHSQNTPGYHIHRLRESQMKLDFWLSWCVCVCLCVSVPDPPQALQLSCDNAEDGTVLCSWTPPANAHGFIREYIVRFLPSPRPKYCLNSVAFTLRIIHHIISQLYFPYYVTNL